jgi:hypothetical protein
MDHIKIPPNKTKWPHGINHKIFNSPKISKNSLNFALDEFLGSKKVGRV